MADHPSLPAQPIDAWTRPVAHFLHVEAASGVVLLVATFVALAAANSPWAEDYHHFWHTHLALSWGSWRLDLPLEAWINDGLMVLFFFTIGMEVKQELVFGELRSPRQALLPVAGALGGMLVPAGIYLALQSGQPGQRGWGIPMATDIAFVVGCMSILGSRVPHGLRVMLLTLAIADDIGAILVIAIGYSSGLNYLALGGAVAGLAAIHVAARVGVRSFTPYIVLGLLVWLAVLASGVHATLAGVVIGLMTPARNYLGSQKLREFVDYAEELLTGDDQEGEAQPPQAAAVARTRLLRRATREMVSPLAYLQSVIHPWVAFVIMPLFALANAGVKFEPADAVSGVAIAAALGLVIGKPVGIVLSCLLVVKAGLCSLPERVGWKLMTGGACLAGIGFTMALFIASLALEGALLSQAKLGVLMGSVVSAALGMALLGTSPKPAPADQPRGEESTTPTAQP